MEETGGVIHQGNHQLSAILFPFHQLSLSLPLPSSLLTYPLPFPTWHSLHVVSLIVTRSPLLSQTYFFTRNERGIFASFFSLPHLFFPLSRRRRAKLGTFSAPRPTLAKLKWLLFSSSYTCTSIYLSLPSESAASTNGNVASPSPLEAEIYDEGC